MTSALTGLQIATIDAIVSVFESEGPGDYGAIARDPRDAGGLSYGKHQAALTKGTLHDLIASYCGAEGAACAADLQTYLPRMKAGDRALDGDQALYDLLKRASRDPVMQAIQDVFFGERYMGPALGLFSTLGFRHALSAAVLYDSFIHSGGLNMRSRTEARFGPPTGDNEEAWIAGYVAVRKEWLSTHANPLLRATAVRMATFERLIAAGNWDLALPLDVVRPAKAYPLTPFDFGAHLFPGNPFRRLDPQKFGLAAPKSASGPNGRDRFIQEALARLGYLKGAVDGVYGQGTALAVKAFQKSLGLPQSGSVDGSVFSRMCDCLEEMADTPDPDPARAGDGLKRLPPEQSTPSSTASAAGAAAAGGAAGVGAIAISAGGAPEDPTGGTAPVAPPASEPTQPPSAEDVPVDGVVLAPSNGSQLPPGEAATETAPGALQGDGSESGAALGKEATPPAPSSSSDASAAPSLPQTDTLKSSGDQAPAVPEGVAAPASSSPVSGGVEAQPSARIEVFGLSASRGEVTAFAVGLLFVAAVALFAIARRTLATGRR
ncbi:MAG: peptidoglycan-binding protein [Alphaproteobacteria bacterium]|nr:peptidoglycan-binding protein [Alphaproteobacteria bacterium]